MYPVIRSRAQTLVQQKEKWVETDGWGDASARVEYLQFPGLGGLGMADHLFTTRLGGVSRGIYSGMNLSFSRGDDPAAVLENFRRVAALMGSDVNHLVTTDQTHTTNIREVFLKDGGKGVCRPREWKDVDGLMTRDKGLILSAFFADCVPLYFVDPLGEAIGLAHAGWRGTIDGIGPGMVRAMGEAYGSKPEEIRVAIGPSICGSCYQVDGPVAEAFLNLQERLLSVLEEIGRHGQVRVRDDGDGLPFIVPDRTEGKYRLDLWLTNLALLYEAGVPLSNIEVTDICTCHNGDYLFSHRQSQGKRGNLGAFLMLKP